MTTFAAVASTLEAKAPDATKHVNYSLGMVLGVDDFNQDFAYLIGRDRWGARDAIGYGTLCGLRVTREDGGSKGPRLRVSSGSALTPQGQLVCVKPDQCAYLNDWLTAHEDEVLTLTGSPMSGTISLYLTLCYRDCPVDLVPIPGAPCRSEDELMAHSRLVDDFSLELRTTPPDQREEDVLRQFVSWLRTLSFGGGSSITPEDFEQLLASSVQVVSASPPSSPVSSSVTLVFGSPLMSLTLDPALATEYYRAAFRVWIEVIRPHVHAICACSCGCCGSKDHDSPKSDECLLLARVEVPVVHSSGNWHVSNPNDIEIDESQRPMLLHLRFLQELITTASPAWSTVGSSIVAAGVVGITNTQLPVLNALAATKVSNAQVKISFGGYTQPSASPVTGAHQYVVKALAHASAINNPIITLDSFDIDGIVLRVVRGGGGPLAANHIDTMQFSIEVSRIG